jgi:hypothetical protein
MLKSILISIAAVLFGIFVTVFGVFLSIFADGNINERLILIAIVLLVLFILSLFFTVIDPKRSTLNVALLASGGIIVLFFNYQNIYYLLYIFSILLACFLGIITGKKIQHRFDKNSLK